MHFCKYCGNQLHGDEVFCPKCGKPVNHQETYRNYEYEGKVMKCPNCGEILESFTGCCPSCGIELRGAKATGSVREFALKLEAIESHREYEKPAGIFGRVYQMQQISKTDEQKISFIKNFSIPNAKEDILEFMILATSNVNYLMHGSFDIPPASTKAVDAAWIAKINQVYIKAKNIYKNDTDFCKIQELYDTCNIKIKKEDKKRIVKRVLFYGWAPALAIGMFIWIAVYSPISEEKEVNRLNAIVEEIELQIENHEFKYALLNAESLIYDGTIRNEEQKRKWSIQRDYWIDKVIEAAAKEGIELEYTPSFDKDKTNEEISNVDEINRIINDKENNQ